MTKISKKSAYPIKNPVVTDYFVGTDSENNNKTVNFGFEQTANLIKKLNGTLIVNYKFVVSENIPLAVLTEGNFLTPENETSIAELTTIYLNKSNLQEEDMTELFQFIKDNASDFSLKLQNSANLKNTCYFIINEVTNHIDYFAFDITIHKLNPALSALKHFDVYFLSFDLTTDIPSKLDKSTYTGNAQDLKNEIDAINNPDAVLKYGTVIETGLNIGIAAEEFQWRISQVTQLHSLASSYTLDEATPAFTRYDILVGHVDGNFRIKKGVEGETLALVPTPDPNTILLRVIQIIGDTIVDSYIPPVTNDFVEKKEFGSYYNSSAENILSEVLMPINTNKLVLAGDTTELHSIVYAFSPFPGKRLLIENRQSADIVIKQSLGTGIHFNMPNNQDYVLKPKHIIEFIYDVDYFPFAHHKFIGEVDKADIQDLQAVDKKINFVAAGKFIVFKVPPNTIADELEPNDIGCGILNDGTFIPFGKYLGGDEQNINNWITNPLTFE